MFYKLLDKFNDNDFLYDSNADFTSELLNHRNLPKAVCRANTKQEAILIFKAEKDTLNLNLNNEIIEATEEEYNLFLNDLSEK